MAYPRKYHIDKPASPAERKQKQRKCQNSKRIEITIDVDLLSVIDFDARQKNITRSKLINDCLLEYYPQDESEEVM
jgi:hypothetical protein